VCAAKGRAEGEAKGRVFALLAVLDARRLTLSHEDRVRITECADLALLDRWIARAATAATAAEMFAQE
jgi:hypothetical protein